MPGAGGRNQDYLYLISRICPQRAGSCKITRHSQEGHIVPAMSLETLQVHPVDAFTLEYDVIAQHFAHTL